MRAVKIFRILDETLVEDAGRFFLIDLAWDDVFRSVDPRSEIEAAMRAASVRPGPSDAELLAPIGAQEVWAAGVTYTRSRAARMEESSKAGGGDFYALVYEAERPELFFKATAHRVAGPGQVVRIRRDSRWNVPEPELVLAVNAAGHIFGYTVGNDMSSRDIEGENPLYLPQAKVYDGSCALGPGVLLAEGPLDRSMRISLAILRGDRIEFADSIALTELKRDPETLVEYLFRDNSFPNGCLLMTGTGIVPPTTFTLERGDRIRIAIGPIGVLENEVA